MIIEEIAFAVALKLWKEPDFKASLLEEFPELEDVGDDVFQEGAARRDFLNRIGKRKEELRKWVSQIVANRPDWIPEIQAIWKAYKATPLQVSKERSSSILLMGPTLWRRLHLFALFWHKDVEKTHIWLKAFSDGIIEPRANNWWLSTVAQTPPDLSSPESFFAWTVEVHNRMNNILTKTKMSVDDARLLYLRLHKEMQAGQVPISGPSLLSKASNAVQALGRAGRALAAGEKLKVDDEEHERRMEICRTCVNFNEDSQTCRKCGCNLPWKTRLQTEHCPIQLW